MRLVSFQRRVEQQNILMVRARCPLDIFLITVTSVLASCASIYAQRQSTEDVQVASSGRGTITAVDIEPCVDRTEGSATRDIAKDATKALSESIAASKVFVIQKDAPLRLTCDVERFAEGSAVKRWVSPGWGGTVAEVAVTVWNAKTEKILITERSQASVKSGGLYTIGAEEAILRMAFDDAVKKLMAWEQGTTAASTK
jgi:hypothetical protein